MEFSNLGLLRHKRLPPAEGGEDQSKGKQPRVLVGYVRRGMLIWGTNFIILEILEYYVDKWTSQHSLTRVVYEGPDDDSEDLHAEAEDVEDSSQNAHPGLLELLPQTEQPQQRRDRRRSVRRHNGSEGVCEGKR